MHLAKGEARPSGGDAQITGSHDFTAAADGVAVDGGDDRRGQLGQRGQRGAHAPVQPLPGCRLGVACQFFQIAAGDKGRARAAENKHAHGRIAPGGGPAGFGDRLGEGLLRRPGQGVA